MAIRNYIFRLNNQLQNLAAKRSLGYLNQYNEKNGQVASAIRFVENVKQYLRLRENTDNIVRAQLNNELDKKEFDILRRYKNEGVQSPLVNAHDVLEQLDKIQVLRNLRMIEENEADYDPELVKYEKLKARVLLDEPGAYEEYVQYAQNRPYHKQYQKWNNNEDSIKQQLLY